MLKRHSLAGASRPHEDDRAMHVGLRDERGKAFDAGTRLEVPVVRPNPSLGPPPIVQTRAMATLFGRD